MGVYVTPPPFTQITVNTNITDLSEFLEHLLCSTNMKCLTPKQVHSYSHSHIPILPFLPLGVYIPMLPFRLSHSHAFIPNIPFPIPMLPFISPISHTFIPSISFPHSKYFIPSFQVSQSPIPILPFIHSHVSIPPFPYFHSPIPRL